MSYSLSLQVFQNSKLGNLHYIIKEGEPWFLAKDVAEILGYRQSNNMIQSLNSEDIGKAEPSCFNQDGLIHKFASKPLTIINESGLYDAIFNSRKPNAREFRRWVTSEVLPSIRRTGSYNVENSFDDMSLESFKRNAENAQKIYQMYKSQLELKRSQETVLKEQEQLKLEQQSQKQELNSLKETIEFQTKGDQHYTISGYARKLEIKLARNTKIMYGKLAKKLSLKLGYDIGFISHPEYNKVNTYHQDILEMVFDEDDKQDEFNF